MARRKPARAHEAVLNTEVPTIIEFLLDETGSMLDCKTATVAGYNDFLDEQRKQSGTCLLTLTKFDTGGQKTPYVDLNIGMIPHMQEDWFIPGGGTNLRDTIGSRMAALKERLATWTIKPNVLFVVMTDGGDNASRTYSEDATRAALKHHMEEGWTFVYLGADQDALAVAERLGFPAGNTKSFASAKMRETMQTLAKATTAYRAARAPASTADTDFFNASR